MKPTYMTIKTTINFGNSPNKNNRIYPPEVVEKMCEQINKDKKYVYMGIPDSPNVNLQKIAGFVEEATYQKESNSLTLKIKSKDKFLFNMISTDPKQFSEYFAIVPSGFGDLIDNVVNKDTYELISLSIIPKQDSSLEKETL